MASDERHRTGGEPPEELTEEQAGRMLAAANEVIRAGEEARGLRAELIRLLTGLGWTQERIARLADMSQPAVSRHVVKFHADGPRPAVDLSLDQNDAPWLEGRLWALAETIAHTLNGTALCARYTDALARGRKRFTPRNVDELRRLVEEDLRLHRAELPGGCQDVYDRIGRALDVPPKEAATPAAPPSMRRALAHRIQRDRFEGAARSSRQGAGQ
ncbi:sigma-70 family RNA polymerase sigma factor [Streptomyces sp. NPDC057499]|uniref:sigma-70 family RNA polymerase sigma factor n=1 Tax=Streptomyces sp. NPDC057499 TaxID=3346150 RepID=UPI00367AB1DF